VENRTRRGSLGDGLTMAAEFAAGPLLFGAIGWMLDRLLGTEPLFLVLFASFGVVGAFVTFFFRYQSAIDRENVGKPWMGRR
jgi:F0F1-type ATP synthase assembly protein I